MGRQRQVYEPFHWVFPPDFPERLERFKEESGLSPNPPREGVWLAS